MKDLLVVIDMVNGFVNFGNLADPKINKITPTIIKLIEQSIQNKNKIIAFCDNHKQNDIEFETYPEHCLEGSPESELIPELKPYEKNMQIIKKPTTDGFNTDEFKSFIQNNKFENVIVCGCCTDICVQNFCNSLKNYFDKEKISSKISVVSDAVYTFDAPNHNAEECNKKALKEMKESGIVICEEKDFCNCLER